MAIEIKGNWTKGYALDFHTLDSDFIGHNQQGFPIFNTTYSDIGKLVHDLKYNNNQAVIPQIIDKIEKEINGIENFHYFISVPPSNTDRSFQPVVLVCQALSDKFNIPYLQDAIIKQKSTEEIKKIQDPEQRKKILEKVILFNNKYDLENKNILVLDDLYRSGSTLSVVTNVLYNSGKARNIDVLTLTKTRVNK